MDLRSRPEVLPDNTRTSVFNRRAFFGIQTAPETPQSAESSGASIWKTLRRHKFILTVSALVCALAAFLFANTQPRVFVSTVAIEIQDFNDNVLDTADVNSVARNSSSDSYLTTEIEALSTESLLERVAQKLKIEERFRSSSTRPGKLDGLRRLLGISRPHPTPREQAVEMIQRGMEVTAPKTSSRIVRISFSAEDPDFAAKVANTIAQEFIDQNMDLRLDSSRKNSAWLAQQIEDLRARVQSSEAEVERFGDSAGLLITSDKDNIAEAKLKELQDELSKAQADRIDKESRHDVVLKGGPQTPAELLDSGPLRDYQVKLADAAQRLAELEATYTANHPKVLQTQAEVAAIQTSIENERKNVIRRINNEFTTAQRREALLTSAFEAQTRMVTAQEAQAARYMLLKNEADTNKQLYDAMLQKVKSLNIASAMQARNILIVDAAQPPLSPSAPKPLTSSVVGLITGFLMAGVFLIARERTNQSIQTPGATQNVLRVPELGAIPTVPRHMLANRKLSIAPAGSGGPRQPELITLHEGDSAVADSYRAVMASLLFSRAGSERGQVFAITSPMPAEGKTTAMCNLGIALTRIKRNVLVIDADFRKPRLSKVFGITTEHGLADVLKEETRLSDYALAAVVAETSIAHLSILPIGSTSAAADVDLLHSPRLKQLIDRVRGEFDFVLIDTPPVIPVPDARIIGRQVDGVLLICRASVTTSAELRTASARLQEDGTRVVGTVLNDFDPAEAGNYYKTAHYYRMS